MGQIPGIFYYLTNDWLSLAPFGVALFFLISGFVIPFSLKGHDAGGFLLARAFRIYPTYIVTLLIQLAAIYLSVAYWGGEFAYSVKQILGNMTLFHTVLGVGSIDLVNWTLAVEIKFYIIALLLRQSIAGGRVIPLFVFSTISLSLNCVTATFSIAQPEGVFALYKEMMFIGYMSIGVLFNYHIRGMISTKRFVPAVAVGFGMFSVCWKFGVGGPDFSYFYLSYTWALLVFSGAYCLREKARSIRILDWLADISYPLYLVHSLIGYAVMRFLMVKVHLGYWESMAVAVALVLALAHAIHATVESGSIAFAKRFKTAVARPPLEDVIGEVRATGSSLDAAPSLPEATVLRPAIPERAL